MERRQQQLNCNRRLNVSFVTFVTDFLMFIKKPNLSHVEKLDNYDNFLFFSNYA